MTSFRRTSVAVLLTLLVWAVPKSYAQPIARVEIVEVGLAEKEAPLAVRVSSPGWNVDAQYGPEGESVAYVTTRSGDVELWMHRDGKGSHPLVALNATVIRGIRWSPAGDRVAIAVSAPVRPGEASSGVYVVTVPDGRVQRIDLPGDWIGALPAGWSQDGRLLYVRASTPEQSRALFSVSIGAGDVHRVASSSGLRVQERDGWLFLTDPVRGGLWRLPLDGGAREHVARLDLVDAESWDVTPEAVYLVDRRMGAPWLLRIDAQTGAGSRVLPLPETYAGGLDVDPDGTRVLVSRFAVSEGILSADNRE